MQSRISGTDLAAQLPDVLQRVPDRGGRFVVERNGEPIATLAPASPMPPITLRELAARLEDIQIPGDGFADDREAIQAAQPRATLQGWPN